MWRRPVLFLVFIFSLFSHGYVLAASVVISEIAWMGTTESANDEWIELCNVSGLAVDLTGWSLVAEDGTPSISLSGSAAGNSSFLLERTDDSSAPTASADSIYTGGLSNSGEVLTLLNGAGETIDSVNAWHAGENDTKQTMERVDLGNAWSSSVSPGGTAGDCSALVLASAEEDQSVEEVTEFETENVSHDSAAEETLVEEAEDDSTLESAAIEENTLDDIYDDSQLPESSLENPADAAYISEVVTDPMQDWSSEDFMSAGTGTVSSVDEWVEIAITASGQDLTNWTISIEDGSDVTGGLEAGGAFSFSHYISEAGGASTSTISGDVLVLGNPIGSHSINNNAVITLYDGDGATVDTLALAAGNVPSGNAESILDEAVTRLSSGGYAKLPGSPGVLPDTSHPPLFLSAAAKSLFPIPGDTVQATVSVANLSSSDTEAFITAYSSFGEPFEYTLSLPSETAIEEALTLSTVDEDTTFTFFMSGQEVDAVTFSPSYHVVISELLPSPFGTDADEEMIELYNPASTSISVEGFTINGITLSGVIPSGGYAFISAGETGARTESPQRLAYLGDFSSLPASGDTLFLYDASGEVVDEATYPEVPEGASYGRSPSGLWQQYANPTAGYENEDANTGPTAVITVQSSGDTVGSCSLSFNPTGALSTDPEGSPLSFVWDIAGTEYIGENPSSYTFGPGVHTISLTVTDVFGAEDEDTLTLAVSSCEGGSTTQTLAVTTVPDTFRPTQAALPHNSSLVISEVVFHETDFVEITYLGSGHASLEELMLVTDEPIFTFPEDTLLTSGQRAVIFFTDTIQPSDAAYTFYVAGGLTSTDETLALMDIGGFVYDAVVWSDGSFSTAEAEDTLHLFEVEAWNSSSAEDALLSSDIPKGFSFARYEHTDTNTATDWYLQPHPTPGSPNPPPPVSAGHPVTISHVSAFDAKGNDTITLSCAGCTANARIDFWQIVMNDTLVWTAPPHTFVRADAPISIPVPMPASGASLFLLDALSKEADTFCWGDFSEKAAFCAPAFGVNSVIEKTAAGTYSASKAHTLLTADTAGLQLTEIASNPLESSYEWIELYNPSDFFVSLSSIELVINDKPHTFENDELISPDEVKVIPVSGLRNNGGVVKVFYPSGKSKLHAYPKMPKGASYQLFNNTWFTSFSPTMGTLAPMLPAAHLSDADGDGIADRAEKIIGTEKHNYDTDGDGIPDGFEMIYGLDPLALDATEDTLSAYTHALTTLAETTAVQVGDAITLTGFAPMGGSVHLTFHSDVQRVTIPVGQNGRWQYTVDVPLASGRHSVFAEVHDPLGGKSALTKVGSFSLGSSLLPQPFSLYIQHVQPTTERGVQEHIRLAAGPSGPSHLSGVQLVLGGDIFTFKHEPPLAANETRDVFYDESRFRLKDTGGTVMLIAPSGRLLHSFSWNAEKNATSTPSSLKEEKASRASSLSRDASSVSAFGPHPLIISEVFVNPPGRDSGKEWVEVSALASTELSGYFLVSGRSKRALSGMLLPGNPMVIAMPLKNNNGSVQLMHADTVLHTASWLGAESEHSISFYEGYFVSTAPTPEKENIFTTTIFKGAVKSLHLDTATFSSENHTLTLAISPFHAAALSVGAEVSIEHTGQHLSRILSIARSPQHFVVSSTTSSHMLIALLSLFLLTFFAYMAYGVLKRRKAGR